MLPQSFLSRYFLAAYANPQSPKLYSHFVPPNPDPDGLCFDAHRNAQPVLPTRVCVAQLPERLPGGALRFPVKLNDCRSCSLVQEYPNVYNRGVRILQSVKDLI